MAMSPAAPTSACSMPYRPIVLIASSAVYPLAMPPMFQLHARRQKLDCMVLRVELHVLRADRFSGIGNAQCGRQFMLLA